MLSIKKLDNNKLTTISKSAKFQKKHSLNLSIIQNA